MQVTFEGTPDAIKNEMYSYLGLSKTISLESSVVQLLINEELIQAVKLYKDTLQIGLVDAKHAVEKIGEKYNLRRDNTWNFLRR